jgi:phenylacetic acid degradation operon negative regulatory protein
MAAHQADEADAVQGDPSQAGPTTSTGSARSLVVTIFAELVLPNADGAWTSSLLYLLTRLGIEEQTARQGIARCAAAGWIDGHRHGREVRWTLTDAGRRLIEEGARRVYSLGADEEQWDGNWLVVLVSVPQTRRLVRKKLYGALSWEGFGNPTPGVWLSPYPHRRAQIQRVVDDLELGGSTLAFLGSSLSVGLSDEEIVRRSWNLDAVAQRYRKLLAGFNGLAPEQGDPLLLTHVQLVNAWQRFPFLDPQLPAALLPDWIGRRAAAVFTGLRSRWYEDAQNRWRAVVTETSP